MFHSQLPSEYEKCFSKFGKHWFPIHDASLDVFDGLNEIWLNTKWLTYIQLLFTDCQQFSWIFATLHMQY